MAKRRTIPLMAMNLLQNPESDQTENDIPDPTDPRIKDPALRAGETEHQEGIIDHQRREKTDEKAREVIGAI